MKDNNSSAGESQSASGATGVIYVITCLVNGKQYVGQTRQSLKMRIDQHKRGSRRGRPGIDAAIAKYGWSDETFKVEVLEVCPVEMLNEREIFWIATLNSKTPNGYNLTDGGDGGLNPSEETRAKISANHADVSGRNNPFYGKKHSEETCAKISLAKKGKSHKPHSAETRAKIAASNKGKHSQNKGKPSPKKGKPLSADTRAKMSAAHKGKIFSDEHRAKLSMALQGKNHPQYGKHPSKETRAKMSAAQKAYWARKKALEHGGDK